MPAMMYFHNFIFHQLAITEAIISDLIINCAIPLSIVENDSFRHLLSVLDNKYQPVSRGIVSYHISDMVKNNESPLKIKLNKNPGFGQL